MTYSEMKPTPPGLLGQSGPTSHNCISVYKLLDFYFILTLITTQSLRRKETVVLCVNAETNCTGPFCLLRTNIVHKHSFMLYQNHKFFGFASLNCSRPWFPN